MCIFKCRWLKSYFSVAIWYAEFLLISKSASEDETVLIHSAALHSLLVI